MNNQPQPTGPRSAINPTRRTVMLVGAATAATILGPGVATAATATQATAASPAAGPSAGLQPFASYWFPDSLPAGSPGAGITWRSLKNWRPEDDPDLAFNTSTVPLAERFTPVPVNSNARANQARITSLVSFGPTSQNPSQGSATADYYALAHWQYIDELVFWGGSSGEGLILAPNAPVVDAAHRNGVAVLGNVFLPPTAFGGQLQWTRDLVQRDALGRFPVAEKLIEVAAAYGFDGWFINAETDGGDAQLGSDMHDFMRRLHSLATAAGMRITWYDAMTVERPGQLAGRTRLRQPDVLPGRRGAVSDPMFIDFRWSVTAQALTSSGALADRLGRSRYELWAGVDVESNGFNTSVDWDAIARRPVGRRLARLLPSRVDPQPAAARAARPATSTPPTTGSGPASPSTRPSPTSPASGGPRPSRSRTGRPSPSSRSPVPSTPVTGCTGTRTARSTRQPRGTISASRTGCPIAAGSCVPTGVSPAVTFDFADAWRGGSSLLIDGAVTAPVTVDLYSTRLPLSPDTVVELIHRAEAGPVTVELAVATEEPKTPGEPVGYRYLAAGTLKPTGSGWTTATLRLGKLLRGHGVKTVHALGIRLTPASGAPAVSYRLGALAVHNGARTPAAPHRLRITAAAAEGDGTAFRFSWDGARGDIRHYELHRVLPDGSRRFLGGTSATAFYVAAQRPEQGEAAARFEVRAVGELYSLSAAAKVSRHW